MTKSNAVAERSSITILADITASARHEVGVRPIQPRPGFWHATLGLRLQVTQAIMISMQSSPTANRTSARRLTGPPARKQDWTCMAGASVQRAVLEALAARADGAEYQHRFASFPMTIPPVIHENATEIEHHTP